MRPALIRLYLAVSADGFIAGPGGDVGWLSPYPAERFGFESFLKSIGAIVMGRASFEDALRLGPWAFADKRVIVLTSRPLIAPPKGVETWRDGIVALAESARKNGDVWLFGGARTTRAFAQAGLIDRYELYVVPELLGDGLRLFDSGGLRQGLRLMETRPYPQGVVALVYAARAGD